MSSLSIRNMNWTTGQRELESNNAGVDHVAVLEAVIKTIEESILFCEKRGIDTSRLRKKLSENQNELEAMRQEREAQQCIDWLDPRTDAERDIDQWQDETLATRESDKPL